MKSSIAKSIKALNAFFLLRLHLEDMDREYWDSLSWQETGVFSGSKLPQLQPTVAINAPLPVLPDLPAEALQDDVDTASITSTSEQSSTALPQEPPKDPVPLSQSEISQKASQVLLNAQIDAHKAWLWTQ